MPIDPNGTRPISTMRPESFSHSTEPRPMPIENTASSSVTTFWSPPSTLRAKAKNEVRKVAPTNHSHEMPSRLRNTARWLLASFRLRQVSETGFQLMRRSGCEAGDTGTPRAVSQPPTAITRQATPVSAGPTSSPSRVKLASSPPPMVPIRMATKVPISTRPLPPTSSEACRCCGR